MIRKISRGETAKDAPSPKKRGRIKVRGGEGAALKVSSDLSIIFNYAIERRIVQANPVTHARKPRAGKRHEFLSAADFAKMGQARSEEHTSELQSLMRISYAVFSLKKKKKRQKQTNNN